MRVVAGAARGRRLAAPPGTTTRPTSDRVRQALFNALDSLGAVEGARVLDAYAGSGALGIEALSRGAQRVTFADTDATSRKVVTANLAATQMATQATVLGVDARVALAQGGPWDLVLLDPPYAFDDWDELLDLAAEHLDGDGLVVIESDRAVDLPPSFDALRVKGYGSTVVTFATLHGDAS